MRITPKEWLFHDEPESSPFADVLTPADIPSRFDGVSLLDRIALLNKTIVVNFANTPEFTDPNSALMCVVVLTSDGQTGTLTHVDIHADVESIVRRLKKVLKKPTPVSLTGAETHVSDHLLDKLVHSLCRRGFMVHTELPHSELGGSNVTRRAKLYPDRVQVKKDVQGYETQWITLEFPTR